MRAAWPVANQQFGVATASAYVWAGMIGLGYGEGYNTQYPALLDRLVEDEYISQRVFSVGLGGASGGNSKFLRMVRQQQEHSETWLKTAG